MARGVKLGNKHWDGWERVMDHLESLKPIHKLLKVIPFLHSQAFA